MSVKLLKKAPLTAQARQVVEEMIQQGNLKPGDKLPSEHELAESTGIARTTVREAYKLLEQDGLVNTIHGRGRFLSELAGLVSGRPVTAFESITEMMRSLGYEVRNEVIAVEEREAKAEESYSLKIPEGSKVVDLSRLRWHEDDLFIYSRNVISREFLGDRSAEDFDWSGSLVTVLASLGQEPVASIASLQGGFLPSGLPGVDERQRELPWLLVVETAVNSEGLPVLYAADYHRGDVFSFQAIRTRNDGHGSPAENGLGLKLRIRPDDEREESHVDS
ncbi:MAG: GntR family transcriptional regulator [Actinobacteria bacterium]|nr:GntR family transcriptional regulator [Actinomycetota bacterium]